MTPITLTISPQSAFGDQIYGDTLFGQICWGIAERFGEQKLNELLAGYTESQPFLVVSDAFPAGYIPRPLLPAAYSSQIIDPTERKAMKSKTWLNLDDIKNSSQPINQLADTHAKNNTEVGFIREAHAQTHNSINRLTSTTGEAGFAPYQANQIWFGTDTLLDIYCVLDQSRLSQQDFQQIIEDIGAAGYGRDATIGLGKFKLEKLAESKLPHHANATHYLALGNLAPQGLGFQPEDSFYKVFTRFGRHGSNAAIGGKPFKAPILLTRPGSVFSQPNPTANFIGQGLGGENNPISNHDNKTVHQGYAPVLRVLIKKTAS